MVCAAMMVMGGLTLSECTDDRVYAQTCAQKRDRSGYSPRRPLFERRVTNPASVRGQARRCWTVDPVERWTQHNADPTGAKVDTTLGFEPPRPVDGSVTASRR